MSGSTTRDASQAPFAADSVFNLPLGSGAQWQANGQLSSANVFVNTVDSGYNENIYTSTANDPLVTVTSSGSTGGVAGTFQTHLPADAVPASGSDGPLSVDDTTSHTWYSFGGFTRTGPGTATASQASAQPDNGLGLVDGSNWDQGVGALRQSDLQAGTINHMLRMELPTSMLQSYSSSAYQLAPYAWPQTQEDGNGPSLYTGSVPFGVTIGIPLSAVEPGDVAANAGADMLWHALQNHGAMVRDSGGDGNIVIFQADQNVDPYNPLVLGMDQFGAKVMAAAQILTNQGPNSVNGGGAPIVPLNGSMSTGSGTSTTNTSPGATGTAGTTTDGDTATISPAALSNGQSPSGSASGMAFVASPDNSGAAADSGLLTHAPSPSDVSPTTDLTAAAPSSSDFILPETASSGLPFGAQENASGVGQGDWWISQPNQTTLPANPG